MIASIALAPVLSACSSSGGSCGKVQPCGGDVVGTWTVSSACVNNATIAMQILPTCPQLMANVSSIHLTGTETYNADMTYSVNEVLTASGQATVPPSCLQQSGISVTCAELDLLIQQLISTSPGMLQSAHCAGSSTCSCSFVLAPQNVNTVGTYTLSGNNLTMTASDGTVSADQYCIQNNEMHLITVDATMPVGPTGGVNIGTDTVLTKS